MENLQEELKSMLSLSGRMNRRSYFMNLLMIIGIGYLGAFVLVLPLYLKGFLGIGLVNHRVFCCSRVSYCIGRIHDLNGPTYLAGIYIVARYNSYF